MEFLATVPADVKFKGGQMKQLMKESYRDTLPKSVVERRDKMGFPVPLGRWYRREPVRGFMRDVLLGSAARTRGLVRPERVETMLDDEREYGRGLWGLLNLELWAQTFLDR